MLIVFKYVQNRKFLIVTTLLLLVVFLIWRFIRPMNIFIIEDKIAWPIDTSDAPKLFKNLSAKTCGSCHKKIYDEWKTTIHSKAWTDPYFQVDLKFDSNQFICRLCHTPLDRQLPSIVTGYRDKNKWNPILKPNPDFDAKLQHEGVTCAVCHLRKGKIVGVLGTTNAPHPVKKLDNANRICLRCHTTASERFGVFVKYPPCGTVAEIVHAGPGSENSGKTEKSKAFTGSSGELKVKDIASLGCVNCHMPLVTRPLVEGGAIRNVRRHLWRGGHDRDMVKKALSATFVKKDDTANTYIFLLTLLNSGAKHYFPTGTPDRHLTVIFRAVDKSGRIVKSQKEILKRNMMWRPVIMDLSDTRLQPGKPRKYKFLVSKKDNPVSVEVVVRYHLLDEKRRKRIGYKNKDPISFEIFRKKLGL